MTETILRGRVLRFLREPEGIDDAASYAYDEDGAILVRDGLVAAVGPAADVAAAGGPRRAGHRPPPAPADAGLHRHPHPHAAGAGHRLLGRAAPRLAEHLHLPRRGEVRRPRPRRAHRRRLPRRAPRATAPPPPSPTARSHPASADAFFAAAAGPQPAHDRRQGDDGPQRPRRRHATPPQSSYDDSKALIARWHGQGPRRSTPSPRASPSPRLPAQMEMARALVGRAPRPARADPPLGEPRRDRLHRSRSTRRPATISTSTRRYGLLGPKQPLRPLPSTCSDRETRRDGRNRLGRGLLPDLQPLPRQRPLRRRRPPPSSGVRRAIATDVGGGTSYSMLRTLDEGYKVLALARPEARPAAAPSAGSPAATPEALGARRPHRHPRPRRRGRHRRARQPPPPRPWRCAPRPSSTLAEELFLLETLGDDRAIAATYVMGERWRA